MPDSLMRNAGLLRRELSATNAAYLSRQHLPHAISYGDTAEFLAFDSKTVQRLSRQGKIPAHPVLSGSRNLRRTWRYKLSELDEWAQSRRNSPTAGSATSPKEK